MKPILQSIRALLVFTILTGVLYPLAVTAAAKLFFAKAAAGSLVERNGEIIGSALLAQKNDSPRYFWPRPSAANFATVASGASNQGPTSAALAKAIEERRAKFGTDAPADLLTASGSGLFTLSREASGRARRCRANNDHRAGERTHRRPHRAAPARHLRRTARERPRAQSCARCAVKIRGARASRVLVAASRRDELPCASATSSAMNSTAIHIEESSFRRDAETSTRDARAPRSFPSARKLQGGNLHAT